MAVESSNSRVITMPRRDNSETGLLLRFAHGRRASFILRNFATIAGSLLLGLLLDPVIGALTFFLALSGEALDCVILYKIQDWLYAKMSKRKLHTIVSISGGVQAITIAACVLIAESASDSHGTLFFALAFLSGAAMNAGLYLPYHKPSAIVRLVVYVLTFLYLMAKSATTTTDSTEMVFTLFAGLILVLMNYNMVGFVTRTHSRFKRIETDLLAQSRALKTSNDELNEAQRDSRNLALVAQHARDSIIMAYPNGRIKWVNDSFTRVTGYTPEEVIGKLPAEFLNGPDTDEDGIRKILEARQRGEEIRVEIFNYRKDGTKIWVDTNIVPIKNEQGEVEMVVGIERDITKMKEYAAELELARDAAEAGAVAKTEFLATMSHEIRTPMNAILGMAELLGEAELPQEQATQADIIGESAGALLDIINDILDFSKLDADRMELANEPFDLRQTLQLVRDMLAGQAEAKGLALNVNLAPELPQFVQGDKGRLRQIITNIMGNAIKFTQRGEVSLRACGNVTGGALLLQIEIEDTGIGIPSNKLEHIFDKFSQAETTTTRRFGGTGLGLAIARRLAEVMGGGITVTSREGEGSVFRINVRLNATSQSPKISVPATPAQLPEGMRVLIAEDNAANRLLMSKFAQSTACDIAFATTGLEALEKASSFAPDIIFMDISMPIMDGFEATTKIRALDSKARGVPIIALTANAMEEDRRNCLKIGMDGFLTKPIRKAVFLETLAEWSSSATRNAAE